MTPLQLINIKKVVHPIRTFDSILQMNPKLKTLLDEVKGESTGSAPVTLESVLAGQGQDYVTVGCCIGKQQQSLPLNNISEEELRKIISEVAKSLR